MAAVAAAIALGIAPDPIVKPSVWAAETLIVADGPLEGNRWDPALTPQLPEILDCLAAESPHTRVSVQKSGQVGMTGIGIAWIGSVIAKTPAKMLVVFPTINAVQDFNREKLTPTIEATPALLARVAGQRSRSARASTALNKKFPGGSVILTGANSTADLRSKTVKYVFGDEIDEWPLDLEGQGDPMEMVDARQIAYHATADYKKFECSTPTIKGASRIEVAFAEGDQRRWYVDCPHCHEGQALEFGGKDTRHGLKFNKTWPYRAHYVCKHCGGVIEHHQKRAMVMGGRWVAENPGPGRHPSFHINALGSLLTTWDKIAETFLKAKDDPKKLKAFVNLWLGETWEERGDAPDWQRLYARRADYRQRTIPPGGIIFTGAADVQADGIFFEVVAWGRDGQSWSVDAGFLEGPTADPGAAVWESLTEVYQRRYPDAYGNAWPVDRFAIDSGYNTNAVYLWARRHHKAMAVKGEDGWHRPAISSTPAKVDISLRGKRLRRGVSLWFVGTWGLKSELYENLRKDGLRDGAESNPAGFCHFAEFHDERYFRQLTAEHIGERESKGRVVKEWVAGGPNHFHDCRIYNMAMAQHMGVGRMTDAEWATWEGARTRAPEAAQGDLLAIMDGAPPKPAAEAVAEAKPARPARAKPARRKSNWVSGWKG